MRARISLCLVVAAVACSADRAPATKADPAPPVSDAVRAPVAPPAPVAPAPVAIDASDPSRVTLDIPARDQAPERPDEGWCAETALQEAILYYTGELVPQADINAAGKPRNPDLYWSDVPVAMRGLGLRYAKYTGGKDLDRFLSWVREHIRAGQPVIAGVKLYPTDFPQWGLDHIVLIVGFDADEALVINTTWGRRETRTVEQLTQTDEGISLANRYGDYYAYAIEGRGE